MCFVDHRKLPFMAMLRNIRNMIKAGISEKHHSWVLQKLSDEVFISYICYCCCFSCSYYNLFRQFRPWMPKHVTVNHVSHRDRDQNLWCYCIIIYQWLFCSCEVTASFYDLYFSCVMIFEGRIVAGDARWCVVCAGSSCSQSTIPFPILLGFWSFTWTRGAV